MSQIDSPLHVLSLECDIHTDIYTDTRLWSKLRRAIPVAKGYEKKSGVELLFASNPRTYVLQIFY